MKLPFIKDTTHGDVRRMQPLIAKINALEPEIQKLPDEQIQAEFAKLRKQVGQTSEALNGERDHLVIKKSVQAILEPILPRAFALIRETAWRKLGMRHYDVQLIGGVVMHQGKIAEMKTGEGKTLVATLPLALNALVGRGAHLVTVNDYLAKRDAGWNGPVYHALGLSVAFIGHEQSFVYDPEVTIEDETDPRLQHFRPVSRHEAYAADITYGTNNEFGFDYLRDNMEYHLASLRQREPFFAIVDEVDSILIDEARTPLIISGPAAESTSLYATFAQIVPRLKGEEDYTLDEKSKTAAITDSGIAKVEHQLGIEHLYQADNVLLVHHLEQALIAYAAYKKNKDYVIKDGEVIIVDEFTGRLMHGRRYNEGLHQAIEAKEGVEVKRESETLATISFQNLFRLYPKLSGMTGTAATEAEEFWKIYQLDVVAIPTNRPNVRIDTQDLIYKTEEAKFNAVIQEIIERQNNKQPVLVGTISVAKSERLSRALNRAGVKHQVLNAKYHEREAKTIANAGNPGAVTVATNMAGRGVDIILGGTPPEKAAPKEDFKKWEDDHQTVIEAGGLHVIGTERHESRRIDNQLRGRAARQGDPGSTVFFVSMEDDLMRIFGGERMKGMMDKLGLPDDQAIQHSLISRSIEGAQKKVEGHNFDIRKHLVDYDDVMTKHREVVYRKRRRVLELENVIASEARQSGSDGIATSPAAPRNDKVTWLHEEIVGLMTDSARKTYQEKIDQFGLPVIQQIERQLYLQMIDRWWIDHLNQMDELRSSIGLRAYGQVDPLVEYKREAFGVFERLLANIESEVIENLTRMTISPTPPPAPQAPARQLSYHGADESMAGGSIVAEEQMTSPEENVIASEARQSGLAQTTTRVRAGVQPVDSTYANVGRNDPCPCGAKKPDGTPVKFKHCHGA